MEKLTVKAISLMTGVSPHTLRAWERRYNAVEPKRTETGRRYYSYQDVAKLRLLSKLIELGFSIGQIAPLTESQLRKSIELHINKTESVVSEHDPEFLKQALHAVREYDVARLSKILKDIQHRTSTHAFILSFISPLLSQVGAMVEKGSIDISHEHLMSAVLRHHLGGLLHLMQTETDQHASGRKTILFSTPEDQLHEFGILVGSILAALKGYTVSYLGTNLPASSIGVAAKKIKPEIIVLGLQPGDQHRHPESTIRFLTELDHSAPKRTSIWLGGGGNQFKTILSAFRKNGRSSRTWEALDSFKRFDELLLKQQHQ